MHKKFWLLAAINIKYLSVQRFLRKRKKGNGVLVIQTKHTDENTSKYSIGRFSLLHSILWKTNIICFDLLGLSSNFPASQTQLAASLCKNKETSSLAQSERI
jgi:hypothetical protein